MVPIGHSYQGRGMRSGEHGTVAIHMDIPVRSIPRGASQLSCLPHAEVEHGNGGLDPSQAITSCVKRRLSESGNSDDYLKHCEHITHFSQSSHR